MSELVYATATELAKMIRERDVSPLKVLDAHLERIAQHNPALNAIVTLNQDAARQRATEADAALDRGEVWGPLHGVPVTIKDVFETAGLRTSSSYKPLADYVPRRDATVVARLRAAGAIILGKTNMPMLAMDVQSDSPVFGRANNPWNTAHTTGGSTGGGAASVAAGLSPLEIGSDIAGSVRIPAHYCGVFSLKTSEHLVPLTGHIPELPGAPRSMRHMLIIGPLARSIEDLRLALSLIAGPDGQSWETPPVPVTPVPSRPLREYRFAWTDDFGVPVTQDTRAVLERVAKELTQAGCRVERVSPADFDFEAAWRVLSEMSGAAFGAGVGLIPRLQTTMMNLMITDSSTQMRSLMRGLWMSMPRYVRVLTRRDALITKLERFLSEWDAWLCPVTSGPAFTHRKIGKPIEVDGQKVSYFSASTGYTSIFNMTGSPVVVLPAGSSKDGLPIGIQVVGRRWQDMELLAVAKALTEVTGKFRRPPGY